MKWIHLRKLTTRFVTRGRGAEAFNNLAQRKFDLISVSLNNLPMVSYCFLDEVILRASKAGMLKQIIFRADDEFTLDKLAYIAETRHVNIVVSSLKHKRHRIQPKQFTQQKAVLVDTKDKLSKDK